MPYTIGEWVREHAMVAVYLPSPDGAYEIEGQRYDTAAVPVGVVNGYGVEAPIWYNYRTSPGMELADFKKFSIVEGG